MEESIQIATDALKVFFGMYIFASVVLISYGFYSIFTRSSRIFKDEEGNFKISKPYSIMSSLIYGRPKIVIYRRVLPYDSQGLYGESAVVMGFIYIALGLLMLMPILFWFLAKS